MKSYKIHFSLKISPVTSIFENAATEFDIELREAVPQGKDPIAHLTDRVLEEISRNKDVKITFEKTPSE